MTTAATRRGGDARSLADCFAGVPRSRGRPRPTGSRVHRYTQTEVGAEGGFWQPFSKRYAARIMRAAEQYDLVGRLKHRARRSRAKIGALGHVAIAVLRQLLRYVDPRTGRLDPAIRTLARKTGHSIAAVHAALRRLKAHGFLTWLRRYVPTGNDGLRGPQVEQATNAYAILLPVSVDRLVPDAPPPDDDTHRRAIERAETKRMVDEAPAGALVTDRELAACLDRIDATLKAQERDSTGHDESMR